MNPELVWFRNDLRTLDNPALFHASKSTKPVIAIYIATPEQWLSHDDAPAKIDFWRRNLADLKKSLAELNISLHFFEVARYHHIPKLIISICQQWQISTLHFNQEYPVNEQHRDQAVSNACHQISVACQTYHDQLLFAPKSVRTKAGDPFKVFTPFAKQAKLQLPHSIDLLAAPVKQKNMQARQLADEKELNQLSWPDINQSIQTLWPTGEKVANDNLIQFCQSKAIHTYKTNRDIPFIRGTSFLSPYLASGVISIKQCWLATKRYCQNSDGVVVWQNELLWREFYKHVLIDNPHISKHKAWKDHTKAIPWRNDQAELNAWQQGQTGYPIIDAAMKQLLTSGWMHNRLRMITAMFLSKHLLIDWRLGERWFMQHLIDGELAANNGGWQWCASTGVDAVPYFRLFNPITQSQRFDPQGKFIRHFLPELTDLTNKEIHFPKENRPDSYPPAMIDLAYGRKRALTAFKNLAPPPNHPPI